MVAYVLISELYYIHTQPCKVQCWDYRLFESWPAYLWWLQDCFGFSAGRLGLLCSILGAPQMEFGRWGVPCV